MTKEKQVLSSNIIELEDRIVKGGAFINSITEDCFQAPTTDEYGKVIASTPLELADEVLKIAKQIKEDAIRYEALTSVEEQID